MTRESPHLGALGRTRCLGLAGWRQVPGDVGGRVPASGELGRSNEAPEEISRDVTLVLKNNPGPALMALCIDP